MSEAHSTRSSVEKKIHFVRAYVAAASPCSLRLVDEFFKDVSALLVVFELVKGGACGGEEDDIAGTGAALAAAEWLVSRVSQERMETMPRTGTRFLRQQSQWYRWRGRVREEVS